MRSGAKTPQAYLKSLPPDRRDSIRRVRNIILQNLPKGAEEMMDFGMLAYVVPLKRYPETYNGRPLLIAALASQKNAMSAYLMCVYGDPKIRAWFQSAFKKSGKKLDIGKSCIRFKSADELPLDVIGEAIARVSVDDFLRFHERSRTVKK